MRFATRAFLWSFFPFAALLLVSFWVVQGTVIKTVRRGVHESLTDKQNLMTRANAKSEVQNSRALRVVASNPALEAGVQLLLQAPGSAEARLTVEDQLRDICSGLGFDFLLISSVDHRPLAGVIRRGGELASMDVAHLRPPQRGYFEAEGRIWQVTSVPVNQGPENLATLSVGERFDASAFTTPIVLTRDGHVILSSKTGASAHELESALSHCAAGAECEIAMRGQTWVSLPVNAAEAGGQYVLRSLQSVDGASAPMQSALRKASVVAGFGALLAAMVVGFLSSRSVAKPLSQVVSYLRESERAGMLREFPAELVFVQEIRDLAVSFNRAGAAIRDGHNNLHQAYVQFVGALASALDARDPYTAGHSHRVSEFSCSIAEAMSLPAAEIAQLRIAGLLHDIGKIGINDEVLQKPGKLTTEEFAIIQQHPTIGRRILEGVRGFQPYLDVVELHHEDWDGTGYPHGFHGEQIPVTARIVHVADAYDAMTSDRPYRRGMSHDRALSIIRENAGTQFDPAAVTAFLGIAEAIEKQALRRGAVEPADSSIMSLVEAVTSGRKA